MFKMRLFAVTLTIVVLGTLIFPAAPIRASEEKPTSSPVTAEDYYKDRCHTWHSIGLCWTVDVKGIKVKVGISLKFKWRTPTLWVVNTDTCLKEDWQVASGKVCVKDISIKIKDKKHGSVAFKIGGQACLGKWMLKKCWDTPWMSIKETW